MDPELFLATKLAPPAQMRWYLPRPHLTQALQEGLSRRLTALTAAAGHGKTSTLGHFLSQVQIPSLWMQLDPSDSNLANFLTCLAAGMAQLGAGQRLQRALAEGVLPSHPLTLLLADLADCRQPIALVLDDFHLLAPDSPVVGLVAGLVQHCGEQVHLYICSRSPLPFPTSRLKVTQDAAELTQEDFRFTPDEVAAFLAQMAGVALEGDQLAQICRLTEGWPAALVLLAASLKRRGSVARLTDGFVSADLFTYLADEVVQSIPPELQRFLEESAVLDVCSPGICDAVLQRQDSAAILAQLLRSNLLLTQLGPASFRYHHLLQHFLLERLRMREDGDALCRALHRRAGDWCLAREMHEEAARYYLRGGLFAEAAALIEHLAPVWLRTAKLERLRALLAGLPPEAKDQYPWISLCEARYAHNAGDADAAMGLAHRTLGAFQERKESRGIVQTLTLIGEIHIARQQYEAALDAYQEAQQHLCPHHRHEEGVLLQRRATLAIFIRDSYHEAEEYLRKALSIAVELGDLPGEAEISNMLGLVRFQLGDHRSALTLLQRSTELFRSLGEPPHESGTNLAWAYAHVGRFRDAIAVAEPILAASTTKLQRAYAARHLMYIYTRLADFAKAGALMQTANALAEELDFHDLRVELAVGISAYYRLSGKGQAAIPYANEAVRLARQSEEASFRPQPFMEVILLHLLHTGNASSAARVARRALDRLEHRSPQPFYRMMLTLGLAIAEFRQSRTESRPEGMRLLEAGLAECNRRGYGFFSLHEWPLALTAAIYGLAYGVQPEVCLELLQTMESRLPDPVLQTGIPLAEPEARLIPAAWQALPNESARESFVRLLTPADRRRAVALSAGPSAMKIHCLGPLTVTVGGEPVDIKALKKRKAGQLLVLLLTRDAPFPREQVADMLWPDLDAAAADTSLRVALHHLRRLLEPWLGGRSKSRYIQAECGLIWFSRQPEVEIDLDRFRLALDQGDAAAAAAQADAAVRHYEAACRLYEGELAADEPYSSALQEVRTFLRSRYAGALEWLAAHYWQRLQDPARAILTFRRRLALDETHEPTHQALIRLYLDSGQVAAARRQYAGCREALQSTLGVPPSPETEALLQAVLAAEGPGSSLGKGSAARTDRRS